MNNKFTCDCCNYVTNKHFNYKKHLLTKKHERNVEINTIPKNGTKGKLNGTNDSKNGTINCDYCGKIISRRKNLKRHFKSCKEKIKHNVEQEKQLSDQRALKLERENLKLEREKERLEREKEELNNKLLKYLEEDRNKSYNQTIINNIQNNIRIDMNYIDKNCTDAYDYKIIMDRAFTKEEIDYLNMNSHIEGPYKILHDRCIKDIPIDKRSIHLLDDARKKYYINYDGNWMVDMNGEKLMDTLITKIQPVYLGDLTNMPIKVLLKNNEKFSGLFNSKSQVLSYINEDILLKNNEKLIKSALKLLAKSAKETK